MRTVETKYIIALSQIKGIGSAFIKKHLAFIKQNILNKEKLFELSTKIDLVDLEEYFDNASHILTECDKYNITTVSIIEDNYPKLLLEIKDPPPVLYFKGNKDLLEKAIAIIGSRKSTDLGNKIANKVGEYFSKNWAICNGLVDGIDKYSITKDNGVLPNVIGVLSGGLNFHNTSSKITADLADKILKNNGLLVSEYEPNKKEDQFSGSKASRIQAGLSNSLILIQSSKNGGSKYTIKAFSPLQRPLAVINFKNNNEFSNSESFEGNRLLITKGKQGIMEMCDIKKLESIKLLKILKLEKSTDYKILEQEITTDNNNLHGSFSGQLF